LAYSASVVFIETPVFTRLVGDYFDDEEYGRLQSFLTLHPDAGKIIRGSGGLRKMRWAGSGRGKRGGLRVIYYWWVAKDRISMLIIYPKNERDNLTAAQLGQLKSDLIP
jgi:mRNA-degrading endonuclease RelE of RelBE toxin-antitoxin system